MSTSTAKATEAKATTAGTAPTANQKLEDYLQYTIAQGRLVARMRQAMNSGNATESQQLLTQFFKTDSIVKPKMSTEKYAELVLDARKEGFTEKVQDLLNEVERTAIVAEATTFQQQQEVYTCTESEEKFQQYFKSLHPDVQRVLARRAQTDESIKNEGWSKYITVKHDNRSAPNKRNRRNRNKRRKKKK